MSNKTSYRIKTRQGKLNQKKEMNANISMNFNRIDDRDYTFHKEIESNAILIRKC